MQRRHNTILRTWIYAVRVLCSPFQPSRLYPAQPVSVTIVYTWLCLFFAINLRLSCVCVVISNTCTIFTWSLSWVASGANSRVVRRMHQYVLTWHIVGSLPVSLSHNSGGGINCVRCDICVYHVGLFVFFSGVFLSSGVTGACPVTTDLILRGNVRTITTTTMNGRWTLWCRIYDTRRNCCAFSIIQH